MRRSPRANGVCRKVVGAMSIGVSVVIAFGALANDQPKAAQGQAAGTVDARFMLDPPTQIEAGAEDRCVDGEESATQLVPFKPGPARVLAAVLLHKLSGNGFEFVAPHLAQGIANLSRSIVHETTHSAAASQIGPTWVIGDVCIMPQSGVNATERALSG